MSTRLTPREAHLAAIACRTRAEACEENGRDTPRGWEAREARTWRRIERKLLALSHAVNPTGGV